MADSVFVRVKRVVSGNVGSALDAAERLSGTSIMRQAIRDMDGAVDKARAEGEAARARRLEAEHRLQACRKQLATLKEQARFAMGKGREDLAEAAIARQIDVEAQAAALAKEQSEAAAEESRLGESEAQLELRRGQMERELRALEATQRAAAQDAQSPGSPGARARRRAESAEEAFERAMAAAGGAAGGRSSAEAAAKVAEIEALQKEAAIAERLAALRLAGKPSGPAQAGGKRKPGKAART